MSSDKGKQTGPTAVLLLPMPNPSAGSANPSASLAALWGYILPALNHIVRSPTSVNEAPTIDISYHMGIHTAIYNYFTAQSEAATNARASPHNIECTANCTGGVDRDASTGTATKQASSADLYEHLDKYYTDLARELLLGAPKDNATLIQYIIPCFKHYSIGAHAVNRLLNYVNRHYVKRAVNKENGFKLAELLALAEQRAEVASMLDRVVPLGVLALRRFRTEFIKPLMAAPKVEGQEYRPEATSTGDKSYLPKSRLAHAVREILEVQDITLEERRNLGTGLAATLCAVSVRDGHPLRKKLEKYL
ncbi:hypothetical protein OG21DRAFT_1426019, partial [Imleria badia]